MDFYLLHVSTGLYVLTCVMHSYIVLFDSFPVVTPSIRPLCLDPGPENRNVTERVGGPIRSPEQPDRGELVVAGMRADGEDSNQELDSGVGELV